jgi:hypothetical protein
MLKLIVWIVIIYLVFNWLIKPILRVIIAKNLQKMANDMHQAHSQQSHSAKSNKKEGSISIDYIPKNPSNHSTNKPNIGDYVDYEEIK